jgi:transcriptional regulator with XRE-family HTH domain
MKPSMLLAAWRKSRGLSQMEASAQLGVSQASWSHWEQSERVPSPEMAVRIEMLTAGDVPAPAWSKKRKSPRYSRPRQRAVAVEPPAAVAA